MSLPIGTRENILAADDLKTDVIEVPEWGCALRVRGLTLGEVNRIVALSSDSKGKLSSIKSALFSFIAGVVEPKFTDLDIDELQKKSAVVLRVVKRINQLSGMGEDGVVSVEDAEKN